jgi:hypothetical protein
MHSMLRLGAAAVLVLGTAAAAPAPGATSSGSPGGAPAAVARPVAPAGPTERLAGPQHWCGSNGYTCADPVSNWDELRGFAPAKARGARLSRYIGHDEPMTQFFSNRRGSAGDVAYVIRLPKDPRTRPRQDGSGGTYNFQLHPTFWLGMQLCDDQGAPNPDGLRQTGHATIPCRPNSDANLFASSDPRSPKYFGLGPGQGFMEMQFYPPGWAAWPPGVSCDARRWCAALNIDTFQDNENTGAFNNLDCLNTVGPEPVNFAFLTKNGRSTAPADPQHPEHFVPDLKRDLLMDPGDVLVVHMFDTAAGFRVSIADLSKRTAGSMTASVANGFGSPLFQPDASTCTVQRHAFHPMYSTATQETRNFNAAHTGNVGFSDEIGHFEYCAKVRSDALGTCDEPLGDDTNDPDNAGPDPQGDDVFCLPASTSTRIRIGGCLNTDGDFDSVSYKFTWPGSISNRTADRLLNPEPIRISSPLTKGHEFDGVAFESNISRSESDDTEFGKGTPCQRHVANPADPQPGVGCVNPPPGSNFYPFYSTTKLAGTCMWQFGGPYIPGTTRKFGGSARAEYGPLRTIDYPAAPFGTVTRRLNDFRSDTIANPCKAATLPTRAPR